MSTGTSGSDRSGPSGAARVSRSRCNSFTRACPSRNRSRSTRSRRRRACRPIRPVVLRLRAQRGRSGAASRPRVQRLQGHVHLEPARPRDEVLSFLGASYFRALGKGSATALSARGLASTRRFAHRRGVPPLCRVLDRAARPGATAAHGVCAARLAAGRGCLSLRRCGPALSTARGARPSLSRGKVDKLGIAPLTSMFFYGENQRGPSEDYRPEVHDSDGLSSSSHRRWIWRPLVRTRSACSSPRSPDDGPLGFGLMQRDRDSRITRTRALTRTSGQRLGRARRAAGAGAHRAAGDPGRRTR